MKITGYALREALRRWQLRRDTSEGQFENVLKRFSDEEKESPEEVMLRLQEAELAIASLQEAQSRYNLAIDIEADGQKMTLSKAVKMIGGVGRREKMWRKVAAPTKDPYGRQGDIRDKDQEIAKPTITTQEAGKLAATVARFAGALRQAIAVANAREVDIEISASLLE